MTELRARTNDDLNTPAWLLQAITQQYAPIALDPCSNPWSVVGAEVEWSLDRGEDGLVPSWFEAIGQRLALVNPPYGSEVIRAFVEKIRTEAALGVEVMLLVPCWPDRQWWHAAIKNCVAVAYFWRRIRFGGGAHGAGEFPSALIYWGHAPLRFGAALELHADIRLVRPA